MTDHQVIHGDCADVLPSLDVQADLIVTSPPYDALQNYGGHSFDFDRVADACVDVLKPGGVIVWVVDDQIIDGSETGTSFRHALGFMERGLRLHHTMFFEKAGFSRITNVRYPDVIEYMFVFGKGRPTTVNIIKDRRNITAGAKKSGGTRRQKDGTMKRGGSYEISEFGPRTNLWRYSIGSGHVSSGYKDSAEHPARFPDALARDHIKTWTNAGDMVIDPLAGSGTVLRAAADLGRRSIGIEIHEPYVNIIRKRMSQEVFAL